MRKSFSRQMYLKNIDRRWIDHLDALEDIKDAASLRSYAQKNPLVEYKNEAGDAYDRMLNEITENICRMAAPSGRSHSAMFACPITVRVIAQPPLLRLKWQILEKNLKFLSVFLAHYHHFVLSLPNKQAKTGCGLADATGKPCVLLSCCTVSATNALTS